MPLQQATRSKTKEYLTDICFMSFTNSKSGMQATNCGIHFKTNQLQGNLFDDSIGYMSVNLRDGECLILSDLESWRMPIYTKRLFRS